MIEIKIPEISIEEQTLLIAFGFFRRAEDGVLEMTEKGAQFTLDFLKRKEQDCG